MLQAVTGYVWLDFETGTRQEAVELPKQTQVYIERLSCGHFAIPTGWNGHRRLAKRRQCGRCDRQDQLVPRRGAQEHV